MKVCLLTSSFPRNAEDPAGIFIYHLAKWLARKNVDVSVLAPHDSGCQFFEAGENFRIFRFPYFYPFRFQKLCYGAGIFQNIKSRRILLSQVPLFFLSEMIAGAMLSKKLQPHVIHAHWSIPQGVTGVIAKKILGIPCITTIHGSDVFAMKAPLPGLLNRWVLRKSDICTVNSDQTARITRNISGRDDIVRIPMGVDVDFFKNTGKRQELKKRLGISGRIVLYVGRLIDWKGVNDLILAMPKVLTEFPDATLLIAGDGPERKVLNQLAEDPGIRGKVCFAGVRSQAEIREYYSAADVFVLPSIENSDGETEGLGVVLLEAMSCGVPVIGSNVGGIGDIVKHETTGILVPQKDPGAIAQGILRIFEDERLKTKLVLNGRRFVETHFSWDVVSDRFIHLYKTISNDQRF